MKKGVGGRGVELVGGVRREMATAFGLACEVIAELRSELVR